MDTKGVIRLGKPLCEKVDLVCGEILTKHAGLWREVGLNLGLKSYLLDNIEEENHLQRKRFEKTLEAWIKQDQDNATWGVLELAITNANRAMLGHERLTKMPGVPSSSSVPHQPNSQYGGMEIKPEMMAPSTIPPIGPPNINTATGPVHHSVDQSIVMVAQPPSYFSQKQQPIGNQNAFQLVSDPQYQSMIFQQPYLSHQQVAYPQTQPVMNQQGHQLSAPSQQGTSHDEALVNNRKGGSYIDSQLFIKVTETVCRIETTSSETTSSETTSSEGTGFIGSLLLDTINTHVLVTAHHVIPDMQTARNECSKFIFSRIDGSTVTTVTVKGSDLIDEHDVPKMCPKEMEGGQRGLDYFMVKVNIDSLKDSTGQPLDIKPINLEDTDDAGDDDEVFIIQYPLGRRQCFSSYTCFYADGPLLFYECDTEKGSSGAPVIKEVNNDLKVVAVHRGKSAGEFNFGTHMSSILKHATKGILEQSSKCSPNRDELSERLKKRKKNHLKTQANTSALSTAPQQVGVQNVQYGMSPSMQLSYPTMPLNPTGPLHHPSNQFMMPQPHQYHFQQQPQGPYLPHQSIVNQQQMQYYQSQQPQNQGMTLYQEGYPQSQPGMIQQDHQPSKLPNTLQQVPTLQEIKLMEELKQKKPITMEEKDQFFQELLPFLQSINSLWDKFADYLGIEMAKIESVRADCFSRANNEGNSREMLTWWLRSTSNAKRKWCTIKEAAKSLKLNDLVKSLEDAGVNDDNEPIMRDLQMLVIPKITNSWYEFGGKLEIRTTKLDTIKCDDSGGGVKESMKSIINHWLKTNPDACWEDVITALTAMEETGVVDNIKEYLLSR